jgi:hypothetical protein
MKQKIYFNSCLLTLIIIIINNSICISDNQLNNSKVHNNQFKSKLISSSTVLLEDIKPEFRYYQNKTAHKNIELIDSDINYLLSQLINYERVIIITHGFFGTVNKPWMHKLKNVLIDNHKKMAVIIFGWGNAAMASTFPTYS